jgi:hypothetical protein
VRNIGSNIGSAIGGLIALAICAAVFFFQCVAPFLEDNSDTLTCSDEKIAESCDDPETFAGMTALICGQSNVKFTFNVIKTYPRNNEDPGTYEMVLECEKDFVARWERENKFPEMTMDGLKKTASNGDAKRFIEVLEQFQTTNMSLDAARRAILEH